MIQILKMAYRNLGRNKRRSAFSALALGMGLALLILMAAVFEGEMRNALETSIRLQSGHLQLQSKDYLESKNSLKWADLIEKPETLAAQIASLTPVESATPRLFVSGMISLREETIGVRVIGIDPNASANKLYEQGLVSGEFLTPDDREGILIGKPLAENLKLKAGDQINLLVNTSNGDVDEQLFTIRGIYSTNTTGYDRYVVFLPLAKAQTLTQTEDHASIIFIMLKDRDQTDAVANAIRTENYDLKTWVDMNELLIQTEKFSNAAMTILYLIVLGITSTVITNTLVMAVFERTREIGILAAIGMKGNKIRLLFFAESVLLAVGGVIVGIILGILLVVWFNQGGFYIGDFGISGVTFGDTIYAHLTIQNIINLTIVTFIISLMAAIYPAWLAARMEPVEALRGAE
jgi:ABC-type lipoprotein release transport system permease subunit